MISDLLKAKYASELSFLKGFLEEEDIPCTLLDTSQGVELPVLIAVRELDGGERPIHFIFVPVGDELETLQLLQIYAIFPGEVDAVHVGTLEKLLIAVNRLVGLGSFGLDPENQLYYKYIFAKPKYEKWNRELILETIYLFLFLMERFGSLLEAAATGQLDGETALEELKKLQHNAD
jgi:hypothetical protein